MPEEVRLRTVLQRYSLSIIKCVERAGAVISVSTSLPTLEALFLNNARGVRMPFARKRGLLHGQIRERQEGQAFERLV